MGDSVRDQKFTIFGRFLLIIGELEYCVLESRVNFITEGIALEQVVASPNIEGKFGQLQL